MEVCSTGRNVEVPVVPQEGFEEHLCIWGEVLDGLVRARHLLGNAKILLS